MSAFLIMHALVKLKSPPHSSTASIAASIASCLLITSSISSPFCHTAIVIIFPSVSIINSVAVRYIFAIIVVMLAILAPYDFWLCGWQLSHSVTNRLVDGQKRFLRISHSTIFSGEEPKYDLADGVDDFLSADGIHTRLYAQIIIHITVFTMRTKCAFLLYG